MNYYCDESTHLEHDSMPYLVLGSLRCPASEVSTVSVRLRRIKEHHGRQGRTEVKWTRIAPANVQMYVELVDEFFNTTTLGFRSVVAPKQDLNHAAFGQSHDDWYYKMFYILLHPFLQRQAGNHVYLDYKDTHSRHKIAKLGEALANKERGFERRVVKRLQAIRSHESELLQLADVLIGAVNYANRRLSSSTAKSRVVAHVRERAATDLLHSSSLFETKFNVFHWRPRTGP